MSDYPNDLLNQLKPDDEVILFQQLDLKEVSQGCLGPVTEVKTGEGFVAVTEHRLVVKASEIVTDHGVQTTKLNTINVPINNVSSITVEQMQNNGCMGDASDYALVINVQGGIYHIYTGKTDKIANEFVRSYINLEE